MRLHKALANAGLGSRRTIETWIKAGKIKVNGVPAVIGQSLNANDQVVFEGRLINIEEKIPQAPRVLIYNKPQGEICSRSTIDCDYTVFDALPELEQGRWVMIGRLDLNTSGLILFTNDGDLAHALMHPRFNIDRHYAARVLGQVTQRNIDVLKKGVSLPIGFCRFIDVIPMEKVGGDNQWFHVILSEGKYREVRQLFDSQGCTVSRLIRIKYGPIALPKDLKKGAWRELSAERVEALFSLCKLPA
jgi:23S rRNA pseudouridine2605 synthase